MKETKQSIKPRAPRKYKSPESKEREAAHHFGREGGNPAGESKLAVNQREFYRWAEAKASKADLEKYKSDNSMPWARRRFCELLLEQMNLDDVFALTNQTHGAPKQLIEVQEIPKVEIRLFRKHE